MCYLSRLEAEHFYSVHRHQPFFNRLTEFMSSGRIVAVELLAKGRVFPVSNAKPRQKIYTRNPSI